MRGALRQLALICALTIAALAVVGGGSAGPRTPTSVKADFAAFPGPGRVSWGEQIAYKATLENKSGTTLTKVTFRQSYPAALGVEAILIDHTCPSEPATVTQSNGTKQWVCSFGQQTKSAKLALTVVWQAPPPPDSPTNCDDCLVTTGGWTVKEGSNDIGDPNDTFGMAIVKATLLASGSTGTEKHEAGGYETHSASCEDTEGPGNLQTNPVLDAEDNSVSTTVCVPVQIPLDNNVDLGYAVTLTETGNNARQSEVCIAKLGSNCPGEDATFSAPFVTVIFHVADDALPNKYKITGISHNGAPPLAEGECSSAGECVLDIYLDPQTKIWTMVVTSESNGSYTW